MSRRIAILTPDPEDLTYVDRWPVALERYREAFAPYGAELLATPWTGDWPSNLPVLALLAWGYHKQAERWRERIAEAASIKLINPAPVIAWNTDKRYLQGLAEAGAPTVLTVFADSATPAVMADAAQRLKADRLVVKPVVSAGSYQTAVVNPGERPPITAESAGPVMVQAFLAAVQAEGELSLFFFGGAFSHAARKVAAVGDFRVQPQYGGRLTRIDPTAEMLDAAHAVLAKAPRGLVYARVDLIRDRDGALKLMELEAIEPDLYLDLAPDAGPRFVEAVMQAAG